tara:strand:- start:2450 stop:2605 length:156 start_codon:yes stop_codon:yes gene_type:complete
MTDQNEYRAMSKTTYGTASAALRAAEEHPRGKHHAHQLPNSRWVFWINTQS